MAIVFLDHCHTKRESPLSSDFRSQGHRASWGLNKNAISWAAVKIRSGNCRGLRDFGCTQDLLEFWFRQYPLISQKSIWTMIWGGCKTYGGGKRTRDRALQKNFWTLLKEVLVSSVLVFRTGKTEQ